MKTMKAAMKTIASSADEQAVVGHDERSLYMKTPLTIFGTPRCFSPNRSRITASRKKATAAASSIVLSSRMLRRMTGRNRSFSISAPMTASVTPRRGAPRRRADAELAVDRVGDEAAEHVHLPVREVQDVHQREDERQPKRDQRVLARRDKAR